MGITNKINTRLRRVIKHVSKLKARLPGPRLLNLRVTAIWAKPPRQCSGTTFTGYYPFMIPPKANRNSGLDIFSLNSTLPAKAYLSRFSTREMYLYHTTMLVCLEVKKSWNSARFLPINIINSASKLGLPYISHQAFSISFVNTSHARFKQRLPSPWWRRSEPDICSASSPPSPLSASPPNLRPPLLPQWVGLCKP